MGELSFHRRSIVKRRSPLVVYSRHLELRCRARPRLPSVTLSAQHERPHPVDRRVVRGRRGLAHTHNPRRQRLEPLVVPPLRLGHLGARLTPQVPEGPRRGLCPHFRAHRNTLPGLEVSLRGLHVVPRVGERYTEIEVRRGLVGPQSDGLAEGPGCHAPVLLRLVPQALSQQLIVLVARQRGAPDLPLRELASPLLPGPAILRPLPLLPQLLVKRPVQLPSARVRRAVDAAEVRRRQLFIAAHIADRVLLSLVVHV
eukprot:scaffold134859_cov69-Phaeocystis_antarctica.AAC.3